jgi:hypothetical protein
MPRMAWFLGWLAPATACVLLTLSAVNSENSTCRGPSGYEPMGAMMLSNRSYAAYVSGDFQARQNSLSSVTFDLTNHSGSTPSVSSFWRDRTN